MRYLEDFAVSQKFGSGWLVVDKERIKSLAAVFDAQAFHPEKAVGRGMSFGGLTALVSVLL